MSKPNPKPNDDIEIDMQGVRPPERHNLWKYLLAIDEDDDLKLSDWEVTFISGLIDHGEEYVNNCLSSKQERRLLEIHDKLF